MLQDERLSDSNDFYFEKPLEYALHRCAFYACFTCKEPFFGGLIDCEQELQNEERKEIDKSDLRC